jgi:hypothetical protein
MKPLAPAYAVMLAGAALMLGAARASATAPHARGGHARTVIPDPAKGTRDRVVRPPTPMPTRPSPVVAVPAEPIVIRTGIPVTPTFTVAQTGRTVTLDASASPCSNGPCAFSWRLYREDGNHLGSTMGFGPVLTYTFPAAGVYEIVLTEAQYCAPGGGASLRSCPRTAQQNIAVP